MALDSQPFKGPDLGERPQLEIPSRSSSLSHSSCPNSSLTIEKDSSSASHRPAEAKKTAQTSASSSARATPTPERPARIGHIGAGTGTMETSAASKGSKRLSTTYTPSMSMASNPSKRSASCSAMARNPTRVAKVKRWDGMSRTITDWDGLRRDSELWFDDGDCLIHLYARGQSRRGPSFRVPFKALRERSCGAMFSLCFAQMIPGTTSGTQTPRSGSATPISIPNTCELYIPAPDDSSREHSFQWHLTTRNFFAMIFGKPLVGLHMGKSLIDLQERMHLFRSGQINNHEDFLKYVENQGYRDYVNHSDYALAMLYYAEHYQLREIWIDAFAHCVGMNDNLYLSTEFEPISRVTKALITRAYLEMDLHLGHVMAALSHFLEDDLSPTYLGLGQGARAHLDRFRSFLHGFYVEKFGYWPPPEGPAFSKALYKSMYFDFRNLYDYLVDLDSTESISTQKPASGGICVLQNVQAFDKRHKYTPLPHPLPLLPSAVPSASRMQSQKTLLAFKLGSKQAKTDKYMTARAALTAATNTNDISVISSPLVKAYMRFERECAQKQREEKVSIADARKVRWLLIYGVLQYLVSAICAPPEVRETDEPAYPLCCLIAGTPPWQNGTKALKSPSTLSLNVPETIDSYLSGSPESTEIAKESSISTLRSPIQPDCEAGEYFTHTNVDPEAHRPVSVEVPAPLRISSPPMLRSTSIRSIKKTFSPFASRRNSIVLKAPTQSFCEIIVHGYGNGLNETILDPPTCAATPRSASPHRTAEPVKHKSLVVSEDVQPSVPSRGRSRSQRPANLDLNYNHHPEQERRTPILDSFQMEQLFGPGTPDSSHDSPSSTVSTARDSTWSSRASSTSSASSANQLDCSMSSVESSGLLGGLVKVDSNVSTPVTPPRHGSFSFEFGDLQHSISSSPSSVTEPIDSTIGLAISDPPTEEYLRLNQKITLQEKSQLLLTSFSAESVLLPKADRGHQKKDSIVDIFAALKMPAAAERPKVRFASKTTDIDDAAPSPIVRIPTGAEKTKKQERRRSLRRW